MSYKPTYGELFRKGYVTIAVAAKRTGLTQKMIRHYEAEGLFKPAHVGTNGYRMFSPYEVKMLRAVRAMRGIDMPLNDIRRVVNKKDTAPFTERRALFDEVARTLQELGYATEPAEHKAEADAGDAAVD